jgi:hypothetical protein
MSRPGSPLLYASASSAIKDWHFRLAPERAENHPLRVVVFHLMCRPQGTF